MADENELSIAPRKNEAVPVVEERGGLAPDAGQEPIAANLAAKPSQRVAKSGTWEQLVALGGYMTRTEVHTYAFSVAAQVILSRRWRMWLAR